MLNDPTTGERTEKIAKQRTRGFARPLVPHLSLDPDRPGTIAAMLHIPLKMGAKEIGVLSVHNKVTPRSFSEHERQMLRILADYAAIASENVRLLRLAEKAEETEQRYSSEE
jgi:GAF domain-containing protein